MNQLLWSKEDARLFQLYAVGLHGKTYPKGKKGIADCFADLDVLQIDTLPILGRNHDLVMQARVDGVRPDLTLDTLHQKRLGFEHWDKVYCMIPLKHFPVLRHFMEGSEGKSSWFAQREKELKQKAPQALQKVYRSVKHDGPLSSQELEDLGGPKQSKKGWSSPKYANLALDLLWNQGKLSIAHRHNFRKYFDLSERVIPSEFIGKQRLKKDELWMYWLKKRVSNVGLLPMTGDNEAWVFVKQARARKLIDDMLKRGELSQINVEGIKAPFLAPADANLMLDTASKKRLSTKARFIAPLDQLIWCRNAVKQLWDFEYIWEVYKPPSQRRWGYYVLPVLYKDKFVARFDGKYDRQTGTLYVLSYHKEKGGLPKTHQAIESAFSRFLKYLGGEKIIFGQPKK